MDGFERRRLEKKQAITAAALELFNKFGFGRVSIAEISKKAHVSPVSIYNFFKSKDNLRREIVSDILSQQLENIRKMINADIPFVEKINEYISIRALSGNYLHSGFIFESAESDSVLKALFDEYSAKNKQLILEFVAQGKEQGFFDRSISDKAISLYIDIFQSYMLHNEAAFQALKDDPILTGELYMLFLDGMIRSPGESNPKSK